MTPLLLLRAAAAGRCLYWCPSLSAAAAAASVQLGLRDAKACSITDRQLREHLQNTLCCTVLLLLLEACRSQQRTAELQEGLRRNLSLLPKCPAGAYC